MTDKEIYTIPSDGRFLSMKTNFEIEDTDSEIIIKEIQTIDDIARQYIKEYCIKKDEFMMGEVLKRMPLTVLRKVQQRIEKEIQERTQND